MSNIYKFFRFYQIYGLRRSINKSLGRLRLPFSIVYFVSPLNFFKRKKDIAVIGCGQFAYSTIGYFILTRFGRRFASSYDTNPDKLESFKRAFDVMRGEVLEENKLPELGDDVNYVYIASNHASHTDYAVQCLEQGKVVYIEKPISVSFEQFKTLKDYYAKYSNKIFFGYNRPFSAAIQELRSKMYKDKALTLTCSVVGHFLDKDHWYRNSQEGSRVCGNMGHWLDLAIHLLAAKGKLTYLDISLVCSNENEADDNFSVLLTSGNGDLVNLTLTSRAEPYEGINESIFFQQDELFVKIDDFRRAEFQVGNSKKRRCYWPKDVGHRSAILQAFDKSPSRDGKEVLASTELMLTVAQMVNSGRKTERIDLTSYGL